jgi:hypothetical protein
MPYLSSKSEGAAAKQQAREGQPFGPGFPEPIVAVTEKLEVWASSFKDGGGDYCEFRAFDVSGKPLGSRRISGY